MLVLYQAADVVLDTYPAGSYITSLQVSFRLFAFSSETGVFLYFHSSGSQVAFQGTLPYLGGTVVSSPCPESKSRCHSVGKIENAGGVCKDSNTS